MRVQRLNVSAIFILALSFSIRAETPSEAGVPEFAAAKLSVAKLGPFLEKVGDFANQVVPNAGPLTKIVLANLLFKVPVDESLVYEGPTQIYFAAPFSATSLQDTAVVLPVAKADLFKKNLASISSNGDVAERDGVLSYTQAQPIPLPDKTIYCKLVNGKALIAPSMGLLAQLEKVSNTPATNNADAELLVSVPALKNNYGPLVDWALEEGAKQAAENLNALKKVAGQLDTIKKTVWEIDTLEARVSFDAGSKNVSAELAFAPQKGTKLEEFLANPPPALEGKDTALLLAGAPINAAFKMDGKAVDECLRKFEINHDEMSEELQQAIINLLNGETLLAIDPARSAWIQTRLGGDAATLTKSAEAIQNAILNMTALLMRDVGGVPKDTVYEPVVETIQYKDASITVRKIGSHEGKGKRNSIVHDKNGYFVHSSMSGRWILAAGLKPEAALQSLIDATQANAPVTPELKAAFDAPPPGTLLLVSAKLLEILRIVAIEQANLDGDKLIGGLTDAPVFASIFMTGGKAGLRATLPGSTTKSIYILLSRLKRAGVKLDDLFDLGDNTGDKLPGNVPPPPPQK